MKFKIEQLALVINEGHRTLALEFLADIGITDWVEDTVRADGSVFGVAGQENTAQLRFNYDAFDGKELELLRYTEGRNWIETQGACVSHIGMHCTASELVDWRAFMAWRSIPVAQEVFTSSHTNPVIAGKRRYNYVIFDTRWLIGVDLKFIVRIDTP